MGQLEPVRTKRVSAEDTGLEMGISNRIREFLDIGHSPLPQDLRPMEMA